MGSLNLNIEIDTNGIESRIEKAIDQGVRRAGRKLEDELQDKAEQKIVRENAIWRKELLASFRGETIVRHDGVYVRVENFADHAGPVEDGAVYTDRAPPIQSLLPWVRDNLEGFYLDGGTLRSKLMSARAYHSGGIAHPDFPGYTHAQVDKAFWLQRKIKREGLAPVGFMAYAEAWARREGHDVVSDEISKSLRRNRLQ